MVNTDDIDFVNRRADLEALIDQVMRCRPGTQVYVPISDPGAPPLRPTSPEPKH